jgi:hypothetical protein
MQYFLNSQSHILTEVSAPKHITEETSEHTENNADCSSHLQD